MSGQVVTTPGAAEHVVRVAFSQLTPNRTVANQDESGLGMEAPDPLEAGNRHAQVLLRCEPADVKNGSVFGLKTPGFAQCTVPLVGSESMTVHAPTPEPGCRNTHGPRRLLHFSGWYQGDGGAVMKPAAVEAQQPFQYADAVIPTVAVKVGVEAGAHRNAHLT